MSEPLIPIEEGVGKGKPLPVSRRKFQDILNSGAIQYLRLGRRVYLRQSWIDAYLDSLVRPVVKK